MMYNGYYVFSLWGPLSSGILLGKSRFTGHGYMLRSHSGVFGSDGQVLQPWFFLLNSQDSCFATQSAISFFQKILFIKWGKFSLNSGLLGDFTMGMGCKKPKLGSCQW